MSKINVDEIQMGDIVEMLYDNTKWLCYVTDIDKAKGRVYGIWSDNFKEDWDYVSKLTGHWKVINFEEESKVDELKVYTGKETIEALLEGKVLEVNGAWYRLKGNLEVNINNGEGWKTSTAPFKNITGGNLTEVRPRVGDWVRFKFKGGTHTAKIQKIDSEGYWGEWNQPTSDIATPIYPYEYVTFEILSPEEVSEYKREQAFAKVGRKLNEFRSGDIVYVESTGETAIAISKQNDIDILLHVFNQTGKGYTAKPHQLTPICFAENQVDLS
ncbi:hypothetical protein [Bacillus albus]|uniref:hypothetical protein n=1 Tax=Bacillus albus TaxID=2026189 RepID=UPI0010225B3A|nr:hypothetical protein [Bacillus albus]